MNRASARKSAIYPEMTLSLVLLAGFQGQLDSDLFFSCLYGRVSGEVGFIYRMLLFSV